MSTRSSIAILNKDGTVHGHYCHSDGYLSWNGRMLYLHYKDVDKVKELISLGDMSCLLPEVSPPLGVEHSYDNHCDNVSIFYGRDRGEDEKDVATQKYSSLEEYMKKGNFQEYDYIFNEKKNEWYLINHNTQKLVKLTTALKKDESVSKEVKKMIEAEAQAKKLNKELGKKTDSLKKYKL